MRPLSLVLLLSLSLAVLAGGLEDGEKPSRVVDLTADNFEELTSKGSWLLKFYAPWCSHCKRLAPVWDEAANRLDGSIRFGKIDCTQERALRDKYGVKSYPTLKFLRGGEMREYKGGRTVEALVAFGELIVQPPVAPVTKQNLADTLNRYPVTFLYLGSNGPEQRVFEQVAYRLQGMCGFASAKRGKDHLQALVAELGLTDADLPLVIVLAKGGDQQKFQGEWTEEKLVEWVHKHKLPPVSVLTGGNFDDVVDAGRIAVLAVIPGSESDYVEPLYALANQHKEYAFAMVDGKQFSHYLEQFHITPAGLPTIFALDYANEQYYKPDFDVSTEAGVKVFVRRLIEGKIPVTDLVPWYNPTKYTTKLEKWLSQFDEVAVAVGVFLLLLSILGTVFMCSIYCCDAPEPEDDGPAKANPPRATKPLKAE